MQSDIEIAQAARLSPVMEIAEKIGISRDHIESYGKYKGKISYEGLRILEQQKNATPGKLILVTAMSPTPAGEGKTTTTVGLGDALARIGKRVLICLREPSLGPVFGMKGGAAGGGYAQVVPMEDINLHFTGDFHAIQVAHNLLSSLVDNHIHNGNELEFDLRRITWKRVLDVNDRALRQITVGLGGVSNGFPRQDGFDIVVASEVMAIFCLATSLSDLKVRLGKIVVGYTRGKKAIRATDLNAQGALAVLLKDAFKPNLVQTLENTPALVHGGPFANIAHGCNSLMATQTGLRLADYVVTEAGFGADLGAEKFINIKCRKSGIGPAAVVIVATLRALKYHGGVELAQLKDQNLAAIEKGMSNLNRHLFNLKENLGLNCVVALNQFSSDTPEELEWVRSHLAQQKVRMVLSKHWSEGSRGAVELAETVCELADRAPSQVRFTYPDSMPLFEKVNAIARSLYGAEEVVADAKILAQLKSFEEQGYGHFPICMAKTQYSFSTDPTLRGAPEGHILAIRELRVAAGAEFIVVVCGEIMTMPGLPKLPSAMRIDVDEWGKVSGLF